ncbi:hypothetical protein D8I35_12185 [Corticibacter populi]|uniref:Serine/threonine protein phosphatase n=1 Tax=Corticibacter populi TaxID=1550736 RepID=A0A3M6QS92_9BURK|nr:hypothetical protein D8I35_12185 [Corticibacter populi]
MEQTEDWQAFLQHRLSQQQRLAQRYEQAGRFVWIKRAAPLRSPWRYWAQGALARVLGFAWLRPVSTRMGGPASLAVEVRRLRQLASAGVRVPHVLAVQVDGFVMDELGTHSIMDVLDASLASGATERILPAWRSGLEALGALHDTGNCLSQAFCRNMVIGDAGQIGFIDFEDDPQAVLPLALCQVRDVMCYAQSGALQLLVSGGMTEAQSIWHAWLQQRPVPVQAEVARAVRRLGWLRHLPADRRWGHDTQRVKAAYLLLSGADVTGQTP